MQVNTPFSILSPDFFPSFHNMNKFNFVQDGDCRLPPGFRFEPTDEELVFQYLARKTFSHPLPASVIPEMEVSSFHDPWELAGNSDQDRYFFCSKETNHRNVKRASRATCGGFWKDTGSDKRIVCSKRMPLVGIKKTLMFYKGKHPRAVQTDWVMHMYYIALSGNTPCYYQKRTASLGLLIRLGKWILCHVFKKKSSTKAEIYGRCANTNYNFLTKELSHSDSSTAASSSSSQSDSSTLSDVSSDTACSETNTNP